MAATTNSPSLPQAAQSYDPGAYYDEAFAGTATPRGVYEEVLDSLAQLDLERTHHDVRDRMRRDGCTFGKGVDAEAFKVDVVPRLITFDEWGPLADGLEQRVHALDAFIADVYGEQKIIREGIVPARVVEGAQHFEPELGDLPPAKLHVALAGLDIIRTPTGEFQVLEDNLRTPSGLAYAFAARRAVGKLLQGVADPVPFVELTRDLLSKALHSAGDRVALLTDGPQNTAHWEHAQLAEMMDIPLVTIDELDPAAYDVVYRRTDEDRLRDEDGRMTPVGAKLIDALRAGTLTCVNGLGNGVADDKLVHAYVEDMVRFYLDEEPVVRSVPTYDLSRPECLEEVVDRLEEMVVKPRAEYGGAGVFVGPQSERAERERMARVVREDPESWIAQETVFFSRHPTLIDGELQPRHVDLRAFVTFDGETARTVPGGLTRVAYPEGELVVNSSQGGGGKDTWVVA